MHSDKQQIISYTYITRVRAEKMKMMEVKMGGGRVFEVMGER